MYGGLSSDVVSDVAAVIAEVGDENNASSPHNLWELVRHTQPD